MPGARIRTKLRFLLKVTENTCLYSFERIRVERASYETNQEFIFLADRPQREDEEDEERLRG